MNAADQQLAQEAPEVGIEFDAVVVGAGFGGSVWAVVEAERAAAFCEQWCGYATLPACSLVHNERCSIVGPAASE